MTPRFRFDWAEILIAPTRGLSLRYITILMVSLALALRLVSYLGQFAAAISGVNWGVVADASGWLPLHLEKLSAVSVAIIVLGWWLASLIVITGMIAVSVAELEKLKGNPFARIDQVIQAAWQRLRVVVVHDLLIIGLLFVMLLLGILTGLPALIPSDFLSPIIYGLLLLPAAIVAALVLFVILVWLLGRLALPAVAACEPTPTSFVLTVELFSAVMRQPYRWFGSLGYALIAGKGVSLLYGWFLFVAVSGLITLGSVAAGEGLLHMSQTALSRLPLESATFEALITGWPAWLTLPLESYARNWGGNDSSRFLSNIFLLLLLSITAYWLSVITVALLRTMVVIRRFKDSRDITAEPAYFGRDEYINPPIVTPSSPETSPSPSTAPDTDVI